jgi:hypothetical protein
MPIQIIRPCNTTKKTIFVLGAARGGTSLLALLLKNIGVYMGDSETPYHEDAVFQSGNEINIKKIITERNTKYDIWGVKYPAIIFSIEKYRHLITNPVYLIIYRDIYQIASSASKRHGVPFDLAISEASMTYEHIANRFVNLFPEPLLVASYEKMLKNPLDALRGIVDFLGIPPFNAIQEKNIINATFRKNGYALSKATLIANNLVDDASFDYSLLFPADEANEGIFNRQFEVLRVKIDYFLLLIKDIKDACEIVFNLTQNQDILIISNAMALKAEKWIENEFTITSTDWRELRLKTVELDIKLKSVINYRCLLQLFMEEKITFSQLQVGLSAP